MGKTSDMCCSNPISRMGHLFFMIGFFLVLGCSLSSLTVFELKHSDVQGNLPDDANGDCILFVDEEQVEEGDIEGGDFCRFAIYGAGAVGLGALIHFILFFMKCVVGAEL